MPKLDPRKILTGSDGEIYALDGDYLGDVPECEARYSITNITHRPMGFRGQLRIHDFSEITLTFTRTKITDELLRRFKEANDAGRQMSIDFQCVLRRPSDGAVHRSVFYQCVPDGDVTIFSYRPGEVMSEPWTFFVNGGHDLPELLGA
ncbi:MAG TPA: phage tail tube protein [Chloroflexota bacterium]|nr:phage tail tube protein [Chloroflexota bacterium]